MEQFWWGEGKFHGIATAVLNGVDRAEGAAVFSWQSVVWWMADRRMTGRWWMVKFSWQEEVKSQSTTMTEELLRCSGCFYWTSTHRLDPLPTIDTQMTSSQMSHIRPAGPTSRGKGVLIWQPRNHMFPRLCLFAFSPGAFVHSKRKI